MDHRTPPTVLVIEDDVDTSELIAETVDDHFGGRCAVRCATLAELRRVNHAKADVALCDYTLPDGTGIDALRILTERRDDLPVIMITGERQVATAIDAIRHGAADYVIKFPEFLKTVPIIIEKNLEFARIRRDNGRLQTALASSLAELKRKNRELEEAAARFEEMASTDLLTGLANRRRLEQRLREMFTESVRYGSELSCMMIDLDGFKAINDTLGHQRGDELLMATGRVIQEQIRHADIGCRYGGDEFLIALPHTAHDTTVALAQRLAGAFRAQCERLCGEGARCGMSVGISSRTLSRPADPTQLIAHADAALYRSKLSGRSRIMICGPDGETAVSPDAAASWAA